MVPPVKMMSTSTYVTVHLAMRECTVKLKQMNVPVTLVRMVELVLIWSMGTDVHVHQDFLVS